MSQSRGGSPSSEVPGSPSAGTPSPPPAAFLGQSVIPLVNKLQDIFSQLGSTSTIDLPQVNFFDALAQQQVYFSVYSFQASDHFLALRAFSCSFAS